MNKIQKAALLKSQNRPLAAILLRINTIVYVAFALIVIALIYILAINNYTIGAVFSFVLGSSLGYLLYKLIMEYIGYKINKRKQ
ncbi:hypothetical protein [Parabacteroides sp. FAFU027]|uniref:hypothetical protein n=1 Tax=Parabacteroides sp. FAFU027 TaxID=2922715 RepID=UPI001FAF9A7A|nr:hypothetical protein [Parabacteroides sp. FAFU027]